MGSRRRSRGWVWVGGAPLPLVSPPPSSDICGRGPGRMHDSSGETQLSRSSSFIPNSFEDKQALLPLARTWTWSVRLSRVRNRPALQIHDSCSTLDDGYSIFCWDQRMQYSYSLLLPHAHIAPLCPPLLRLLLYVFRPFLLCRRKKQRTGVCAVGRLIMLQQSPTLFPVCQCSMPGF